MNPIKFILLLLIISTGARSQELYVATEPASNMATGSLGARFNTMLYKMPGDNNYAYRLNPELMIGVSKKWMVHLNAYASNCYQSNLKWEGASAYGKYRFYSMDDVHSHFRMAGFGKLSLNDNPGSLEMHNHIYPTDEISLDGNNSGWQTGIIATQLLHKLALSSTVSFLQRMEYPGGDKTPGQSSEALDYSFSAGYLLFPNHYRDFRQTNFNLYCEFLGSSALDKKAYFVDIAPAIQFIFNSISRLDLSYRTQLIGNMQRLSTSEWVFRFEYNFLNVFKNRK